MKTTNRYHYEIPPHLTVLLVLFYLGLSVCMAHLARRYADLRVVFIAPSAIFGTLALVVLIRRLAFPCTLELTDDAILLPCGHPWPRIKTIPYRDVISIRDGGDSLWINTGRETFWMETIQFAGYHAAREIIFRKIASEPEPLRESEIRPTFDAYEFPIPLVQWMEPDNWIRFRNRAAIAKPLLHQLRTELWLFVRCYLFCCAFIVVLCLGFVFLHWILKWEPFQFVAVSIWPFVGVSFLATIFTLVHWLDEIYPVRQETNIGFRDRGITVRLPSGQQFDWDYRQLCGWSVIERQFQGHVLQILLLKRLVKSRDCHEALALPDAGVRDRVLQILNARQVPHAPDLKPSWEAE